MLIRPENTAIPRGALSKPMAFFLSLAKKRGFEFVTLLDFGCGRGFDFKRLGQRGIAAYGYDPFFQKELPSRTFDVVTMLYILNVIPEEERRKEALKSALSMVSIGGVLFVASRSQKEISREAKKRKWEPHLDGFLTGSGKVRTFQKGISVTYLKGLIQGMDVGAVEIQRNCSFTWSWISC